MSVDPFLGGLLRKIRQRRYLPPYNTPLSDTFTLVVTPKTNQNSETRWQKLTQKTATRDC